MQKSRTNYAIFNIISSLSLKGIILVTSFISRTIFIYALGEKYLGVSGLFSNILSVLSLAELGVGGAMMYSMYPLLSRHDHKKLAALMNYYKKLYSIIGCIVTIIGIVLVPILKYVVNFDTPLPHITLYYLLYLLNTVSTYFFAYKTSIINADQKAYKLNISNTIVCFISFIFQNGVLIIFHNFTLYLIIQVVFSIMPNIYNSYRADKLYPYIKSNEQLSHKEKRDIWVSIRSMFSYQIGSVILNNTDNILISILVGTTAVGYYSNYTMIIMAVSGITSLIFTSTQSSVGNLSANETVEKQYVVFKVLTFIAFWIYAFCSVCFCILFPDFITLWIGGKFLLTKDIMYISTFNFYITGILYPIWVYRNTIGLFRQTRYIMIFTSVINLILSIILGMKFGLAGIIIATCIARITTNVWYEPYKLFKLYFNKPLHKYYFIQIMEGLLVIFIIIIIEIISSNIHLSSLMLQLGLKAILCIVIPNMIIILVFRKTDEYRYIINLVKSKLVRNKKSS